MNDFILYTREDGGSQIQLRAGGGTVWISPLEVAELFQTSKQNVAKHLKAIFADKELSEESVVNHWLTAAADGKNCRGAQYMPLAIGPHSIFYSSCRELPLPNRRGNCLGMLGRSRRKTWTEKGWRELS